MDGQSYQIQWIQQPQQHHGDMKATAVTTTATSILTTDNRHHQHHQHHHHQLHQHHLNHIDGDDVILQNNAAINVATNDDDEHDGEHVDDDDDDDDDVGTADYLVDENGGVVGVVPSEADIDQIAAENLIFMARDGQMVTEIIAAAASDEHGRVVVASNDDGGGVVDCMPLEECVQQIVDDDGDGGGAATTVSDDDGDDVGGGDGDGGVGHMVNGVYDDVTYDETTPQMVTEEIITDDWVQHQGEERVEIPAEQIIGSASQVLLDIEVPLPTVQDEYTALRPYPCDFCSRRFRKKVSLMNHMVAHQNDRPHLCKLCGARFFRRSDLINHLKAHAGDSPNPTFDDVEFINFIEQEQPPHQSRRQANDHYYDHDWSLHQTDAIVIPASSSSCSKSSRSKLQNATSSGNTSSTSTNTNATTTVGATPTSTGRGRVSRLKPKEESFVDYDITCAEFQTDATAVMQHLTSEQQCGGGTTDVVDGQSMRYPIIDDSKPFVCQQCGLAFAREKALLSHTKTHRNDSPYECNQCNEMFWDTSALQEHQKTHQFEDSNSEYDPADGEENDDTHTESESENVYGEFYCSECGMSFHRRVLLRRHYKTHVKRRRRSVESAIDGMRGGDVVPVNEDHNNSKDQHCCNTCGETFDEALALLAHAEIHARYPPYKCVLCGETFFEEYAIKRHLQLSHTHEMTANSCCLCGKQCRDRKALIKHAWDHSREKCHTCSKCGKNFHNKARLKRHMSSHRDKSVVCDVCHEEFPDGRSLSNHRHSHSTSTTGKLFPCNECGKTFGSRSSQQIHVRIHTGERPYGCRFCWKAFADGGTLRKHERIHTGEKPYVCAVCPRAFNQRVVLREHIRSHHSGLDEKRGTYYCSVCSAEMVNSNDLMQHLIQHSDVNTARQRQPITGPRKYKRRRKLKPHEIDRLKSEGGADASNVDGGKHHNGGNASELDLSDFDMENVAEFLADVTETATATTPAIPPPLKGANKKRPKESAAAATRKKTKKATNANSSKTAGTRRMKSINDEAHHHDVAHDDDDVVVDVNGTAKNCDGTITCDKLWQMKLLHATSAATTTNEETLLLTNLENTLQSIDSLVVGNHQNTNHVACGGDDDEGVDGIGEGKRKSHNRTQRAQPLKHEAVDDEHVGDDDGGGGGGVARTGAAALRNRKRTEKPTVKSTASRPRMIHTQKMNRGEAGANDGGGAGGGGGVGGGKKRTKTYITRTTTASTTSSTNYVDDYEIMSPATQPPNQISSSPLHIKQEPTPNTPTLTHHLHQHQHQQQHHQQHHHHQPRKHHTSLSSQEDASSTIEMRAGDFYDAQLLLLDAQSLRKESSTTLEKFNPSIVNDLEEILRSPMKLEKSLDNQQQQNRRQQDHQQSEHQQRHRFTSESSTVQFLVEHSSGEEEEQHLIKIEPTSPDLRDIVTCGIINHNVGVHEDDDDDDDVDDVDDGVVEDDDVDVNDEMAQHIGGHRRATRSAMRQQQQQQRLMATPTTTNRKYLEFESVATTSPRVHRSMAQKRGATGLNKVKKISVTKQQQQQQHKNRSSLASVTSPSAYLTYTIDNNFNSKLSSPPNQTVKTMALPPTSSFSSIVAEAAAVAAAAAAAATAADDDDNGVVLISPSNANLLLQQHQERKQRYFECEMCSAIFPDRAQLLDHVPIHI